MRQKRAKSYRKLMALYSMSFGFREPYQVLVDSQMCISAVDFKMDLVKQLSTVLQGRVKPMITQCSIHELYLQGKLRQPSVDLAKTFERRKCNHREPIPGDDCVSSVVGDSNKHRYVTATQSHPLRVKLRAVPGVPIIHINRTVMVLEPPSDQTLRAKHLAEQGALLPAGEELPLSTAEIPPLSKKKKGPKEPNPLSMKKKKKRIDPPPAGQADTDVVGQKRKRDDVGESTQDVAKPRRKRKKKNAAGTDDSK